MSPTKEKPGIDGLLDEFYKIFKEELNQSFSNSYNNLKRKVNFETHFKKLGSS
jgi:hypothetical protein